MKIVNYLIIALMSLILASCSKVADPVKSFGIGSKNLNYESDQSVESLIIPPDLTAPSSQSALTDAIEDDNDNDVLKRVQSVEVKRDKYRRWLLVDLPPSEVWVLSKDFFRSYGFKIEKENQKIGMRSGRPILNRLTWLGKSSCGLHFTHLLRRAWISSYSLKCHLGQGIILRPGK